jgi:hypothetical protein
MTAALPAPLTATDCDLRDFPFMPLDVQRLRDSDLAALETPEACWAAVQLWGASWHQVPAASLPNDDRVLAALAGYGRVVREWMKVRAGALRGFVLCSDGRFYHPVVAEKAIESHRRKLEQRWRTECGRIKKHNQRTGASVAAPELEAFIAGGCKPVSLTGPTLSPGTDPQCPQGQLAVSPECPPGNGLQGIGIGTGTYKEEKETVASAPPTPTVARCSDDGFEALWSAASPTMRKRAKSRAKVRPEWLKAVAVASAERILAGLIDYLANDPDVGRTGGPGLHIWLKDRTWENWGEARTAVDAAAWTDAQWSLAVEVWRSDRDWAVELGPPPGEPGCRVPPSLLIGTAPGAAA